MKIKSMKISTKIHNADSRDDWRRNIMKFDFEPAKISNGNIYIKSTAIMFLDDHQVAIEAEVVTIHETDKKNFEAQITNIQERHKSALDNHLLTIKEDYPFDWTSNSYDDQFKT